MPKPADKVKKPKKPKAPKQNVEIKFDPENQMYTVEVRNDADMTQNDEQSVATLEEALEVARQALEEFAAGGTEPAA